MDQRVWREDECDCREALWAKEVVEIVLARDGRRFLVVDYALPVEPVFAGRALNHDDVGVGVVSAVAETELSVEIVTVTIPADHRCRCRRRRDHLCRRSRRQLATVGITVAFEVVFPEQFVKLVIEVTVERAPEANADRSSLR